MKTIRKHKHYFVVIKGVMSYSHQKKYLQINCLVKRSNVNKSFKLLIITYSMIKHIVIEPKKELEHRSIHKFVSFKQT